MAINVKLQFHHLGWLVADPIMRKDKDLEQQEPVMMVLLNHHRLLKQQLNNQVLQVILELPGTEILNHQFSKCILWRKR
uniref:Uncharacterized protein LOC104222633 isoform X2 n=1 Tax=Nicotiana sylvestris TaxID=4096 RepID=A0A1U7W0P7_NICSY|nr:PREDICTED: uncharacterized protein LOC104222633 isoform X2 [Nicotiana sylvestris]